MIKTTKTTKRKHKKGRRSKNGEHPISIYQKELIMEEDSVLLETNNPYLFYKLNFNILIKKEEQIF